MRKGDQQLGTPYVQYVNTKTAIEALSGIVVGAVAVATDNPAAPFGVYNGSAWEWYGSVADIAALTHAATSKATPVDADEIPLVDSAASWGLKKLTWANIKSTLATYFGGLYLKLDASNDPVTGQLDVNNVLTATDLQGYGAVPATMSKGLKSPWTRTIIVDAGGKGDYTTIKAACDYVATQSPGSTTQWAIMVNMGTYTESPFTIPSYTTICSNVLNTKSALQHPAISFVGQSTGQMITFGTSSKIVGMTLQGGGTAITGNFTLLYTTSSGASITNCTISIAGKNAATYNVIGIETTNGFYVTNCYITCQISTSGTNFYVIKSSGGSVIVYDTAIASNSASLAYGIYSTSASDTYITNTIIGSPAGINFANDLYQSGGAIYIRQSYYRTSTGTITNLTKYTNTVLGTHEAHSATNIPGTWKGATSQTAHLSRWIDASDNELFVIDANGNPKLLSDALKAYFGAGQDMTIWYDGTNGNIKTSDVAASDLHVQCGTDKTVVLDETVWCDIDFPIIIRSTGTGIPSLTTFNGNLTMPQWAVNDYNQCESQEFIHEWKEGSAVYWHIHLNTNGLDGTDRYVRFELEYGYSEAGVWTFPAAVDTGDILIPANTPDKKQIIMSLANFTPTNSKIGDHAIARLKRIAASGAAPTNSPWIPMLQLHVQKDTIGSRQIATK